LLELKRHDKKAPFMAVFKFNFIFNYQTITMSMRPVGANNPSRMENME